MRVSKKIWLFGLPAILMIGLAVMTVTFFKQRKTIAEQQRVIEAQTESAYHALSNDLYDLNVALGKLEAAATPASIASTELSGRPMQPEWAVTVKPAGIRNLPV